VRCSIGIALSLISGMQYARKLVDFSAIPIKDDPEFVAKLRESLNRNIQFIELPHGFVRFGRFLQKHEKYTS
jgi:hypothetical protein